MRRRLYFAACVLSLLLFVLTIVAWVWSYRLTQPIVWHKPNRFAILRLEAVPGGIWWSRKVGIDRADYGVDYWQIAMFTLVVPLWPLVRWWGQWDAKQRQDAKRRRRMVDSRTKGVCFQCGYDLRATADRCPECGMPINSNVRKPA
ncbi:MAG TPA: hypothetical protein VGI81_27895 [Tepidisphaeraceae bacterium]|jgi:hypothetical protein